MSKPKFDPSGKLVLVTGASSGIGKHIALEFARQGARLALVARNQAALNEVHLQIEKLGQAVQAFPFDLTKIENIAALINKIENHFSGNVDILVNSAGIAVLGLVEDVPPGAYLDNLAINFLAPLALIKAVVPGMRRGKGGQVINISSGAANRGLPGASAYCVSKAALNSLTESLRVELSGENIAIISVSPGLVKTEFQMRAKCYGRWHETMPESAMSDPEYVAQKIVQASIGQKTNVELSPRTRIACHLNYLMPRLLDRILSRKYKQQLSNQS